VTIELDAGFGPLDDLRHRPAPGGRMRDSLFWQLIVPEERFGLQVYLYLTGHGRTGYNVVVWGPGAYRQVLDAANGVVPDEMDFDAFAFEGLTVTQPELRRSCEVRYARGDVRLEYSFTALHEAFSYRSNPDGLPSWFAHNRLEQTGRVRGRLEIGGHQVEWDRVGHRDHSWGVRDWRVPQHWKWFVAYTESGRVVNGWIWIARGEWGCAGYVARDGVTTPIARIDQHADYAEDMTQRRLTADVLDTSGATTRLTMDVFDVARMPARDPMGPVVLEAACTATIDGEPGGGQFETLWSGRYLHDLTGR
jgi:hypothetical protein